MMTDVKKRRKTKTNEKKTLDGMPLLSRLTRCFISSYSEEGDGATIRYAVRAVRVLCGCAYVLCLSRAQAGFSVYPFALAFLCTAKGALPLLCATGILSALLSGSGMATYATLYLLILILRTAVCLAHSFISDGVLRAPEYGEPIQYRLILCCIISTVAGGYTLLFTQSSGYALGGALLLMSATPVSAYIFSATEQHSSVQICTARRLFCSALLVLSLSELNILLINIGRAVASALTVFEARRAKSTAALTGLCAGVAFGLSASAVYGLAGLFGSFSGAISPTVGGVVSYAFILLAQGYVGGYSALLGVLPSASAALFFATVWHRYGLSERISAICLPASLAKSPPPPESSGVLGTADRLSLLSHAFSSMSGMMRSLAKGEDRAHLIDSAGICRAAITAVCHTCPNRTLCWERNKKNTASAMRCIESGITKHSALSERDIPPYLRDTCVSLGSLLSQINSRMREASRSMLEQSGWGTLCSDYDAISRLIDSHVERYAREDATDTVMAGRLLELSKKRLYGIGEIEVLGARRRRIYARGIDLRAHTVSGARLRGEFERVLGTPLSTPEYSMTDSAISLEMHAVPALSVMHASASTPKEGEGCCGDCSRVIENDDGYVYGILCDGMGSGKEAAYTSGVCAEYLSSMLGYSNPKELTIEMLNAVLREREGECSSTVDLFELDTYTGEGCFIKSGAAPSFVCRGKNVYKVASRTIPIGITERIGAEKIKFRLKRGDIVVMVSDGIVEGPDEGRLVVEALCRRTSPDPFDIAASVLARAKSATGARDDMTVLVISVCGA